MESTPLPDPVAVAQAAARIAGDVRQTPLLKLPAASLGLATGATLWLKLEQLQRGGSFKARGMFNRLRAQPLPAAGVVIASGGNAGIAAATAAQALGVRCEVFVPELASEAKRAALRARGAVLVVGGAAYADALAASLQRQQQTGALLLHAYDQPEVVAGAGTLAAEVEAEAGVPERVLVSVGGGGLLGGLLAQWGGRCRVEALEPVGASAPSPGAWCGTMACTATWCPSPPSWARSARCGKSCAWPWSPPRRCRWRRCRPAWCSRRPASACCWWCAAPTWTPAPWPDAGARRPAAGRLIACPA
jgi:hypothetical protein